MQPTQSIYTFSYINARPTFDTEFFRFQVIDYLVFAQVMLRLIIRQTIKYFLVMFIHNSSSLSCSNQNSLADLRKYCSHRLLEIVLIFLWSVSHCCPCGSIGFKCTHISAALALYSACLTCAHWAFCINAPHHVLISSSFTQLFHPLLLSTWKSVTLSSVTTSHQSWVWKSSGMLPCGLKEKSKNMKCLLTVL